MSLTLAQRALRPILNLLVERFFPNGAFYGHGFFDAFREVSGDSNLGQASVAWVVHNMHEMNAEEVRYELGGMSINGTPVGDFEIVGRLTRTKSGEAE